MGTNVETKNYVVIRLACINGNIDVIKYLIAIGTPMDVNNNEAIEIATKNKKQTLINILKEVIKE